MSLYYPEEKKASRISNRDEEKIYIIIDQTFGAGKSTLERCSAKTIRQIAAALDCTMEEIMMLEDPPRYDATTGLPEEKGYLECGLPPYLETSLKNMKKSWEIEDSGQRDLHWDLYWCELNADINSAETDGVISTEQAWYLRQKYLRMERN